MTTDTPATPDPAPHVAAAAALPPLGPNPFVGPRPYQPGERLFGRRQETRELYYLLSAERVVWLHSPSGAGKTSLVWASLAPMLERDGFTVCPPIRVNLDLPGLAQTAPGANPYAMAVLLSLEERLPPAERRSVTALADLGLAAYLSGLADQNRLAGKAGTVLVLDQFEEVLTIHPLDRIAKEAFFQTLGEVLRNPNLWALFVLREEYLAALEPYVDWIPSRWTNTFRLDLLGREAVLEVLARAAEQGGRRFAPDAAEHLFTNLARTQVQQPDGSFREETGRHAEPVQLQVVCRRLWEAMPADDRSIDPDDLERFGDVSAALGGYYADSVARISAGDQALERRLRAWFGEQLIAAGGIRGQVLKGQGSSAGLGEGAVARLLDTHLIREEKRAGATWYELAHDRLIAPVLADNAAWLAAHLQPFQRQVALWVQQGRPPNGGDQRLRARTLRDARRFRRDHPERVNEDEERLIGISLDAHRRRRWAWSLLGLFAVAIIAFAGTAWWLKDRAQEKERAAWYQVAVAHRKDAVAAAAAGDLLSAAHHWAIAAWRFHWAGRPAASANALVALRFIDIDRRLLAMMTHAGPVNGASYSPNGQRILTWSDDRTARVWDVETGRPLTPPLHHDRAVRGARFSRDGTRILTWSGGFWDAGPGSARLWDGVRGQALTPPLPHRGIVFGAELSQDESHILSWDNDAASVWSAFGNGELLSRLRRDGQIGASRFIQDGRRVITTVGSTVQIWDSTSGRPLGEPLEHSDSVRGVILSDNDSRILTWSQDHTARIWDSDTGRALLPALEHPDVVWGARFSPDEARVLTWTRHEARLWDSTTGRLLFAPLVHAALEGAQFSDDGTRILTWGDDGTARLWDSATGQPLATPLKHDAAVSGAALSNDQSRILTWSEDGTARLWSSATGEALVRPLRHDRAVLGAQMSPDDSSILTWSEDGTARLWERVSGAPITLPLKHQARVRQAQFNDAGSRVLTWSQDGTARVWDGTNGHVPAVTPPAGPAVKGGQLSSDGARILTWGGREARLCNSANNRPLTSPLVHDEPVAGAQFCGDESRILTWSGHASRVWNSTTAEPLTGPLNHGGPIEGAQCSSNGSHIVTWGSQTARVWQAAAGEPVGTVLEHRNTVDGAGVVGALFSHDGARIVTWTGYGQEARLWDSASGRPLTPPLKCTDPIHGAQLSHDASRILTWGGNKALVWNSATGAPLTAPLEHGDWVLGARFSDDESLVLTWSSDGAVGLWDSHNGRSLMAPLRHDDPVQGARMSADGALILTWNQDTMRLWDRATGQSMITPGKHQARILGGRVSSDHRWLLSWSEDGSARLWDGTSGKPLSPPLAHDPKVGPPRLDPGETLLSTWTEQGGLRTWSLVVDTHWPIGKWPLLVSVATGTELSSIDELQALSGPDWNRRRFCEYDLIRHDLKRLSDADWADSQRRCQALAAPEQPPTH